MFIVASSAILFSCSTPTTLTRFKSTKTKDIVGSDVRHTPVVADLIVKEVKVSGAATGKAGEPLDNVKNEAVADALSKSGADVLVEPRYVVEKSGGKYNVTVSGYPGFYKNFRPDTVSAPASGPVIQGTGTSKLQVEKPKEPTSGKKKGSGAGAIVVVICGSLAVLSLIPLLIG